MTYIAFFEFSVHDEKGTDAEGSYQVVCEGASVAEVVEKTLPSKLKELDAQLRGPGEYSEHYLVGLVEFTSPTAPIVLGLRLGPLEDKDESVFHELYLDSDEKICRVSKLRAVRVTLPFSSNGKPPERLLGRR